MKVTVYTVPTCQFSKHEKEYLSAKGIPFEEKNLEANRAWLTEMLAISNNFAGTPVTKIEKDNGQTALLKGFTEEEFNKELGLTASQPAMKVDDTVQKPAEPAPSMPANPPVSTPVPESTPTMPSEPVTPPPHVEEPKPEPVAPVTPPPAPATPPAQDALASILADLQKKAGSTTPQATPTQTTPVTPAAMPNIPDFTTK